MMVMVAISLVLLGLCLGSFANALVWRVHEQAEEAEKKSPSKKRLKNLSIMRGRSMCPDCGHVLRARDLVPVLSWLSTGGRCRYCSKRVSAQYPLVEAVTAGVFVLSYYWWPVTLTGAQYIILLLWLVIATGLMALLVYDLRWYLLPNRILYPLAYLAAFLAVTQIVVADSLDRAVFDTAMAVAIGGGLFYVLFQVSKGKWIGGGDVKLGWLLGLIVATPGKALLMIFIAALLGTLVSLILMTRKKLARSSVIPFGPFLIAGAFVAMLFGDQIINWYLYLMLRL